MNQTPHGGLARTDHNHSGPCFYCHAETVWYCGTCRSPMCAACVPGDVCPECHPKQFTPEESDTCSHGIDHSTGYCASCEDASIERASRIVARLRLTSLGIATALFLTVTAPHGCTVVGTVPGDEAFPLAHCADGAFVYADMDGAANHAAGTWVSASGYLPMG